MAIKYYERYPQRWDSPSQDYPQGAFKNLSALGEQDGSYLEEAWLNDQSGFFGALLRNAEMTPNGLVDTAQKSQFYDALLAVANKNTENYFSTRSMGTGKFIREGAGGWFNSTNTRTDKNGYIHAGISVPVDTLIASDLVNLVEQGVDKPVTSGGVFEAIPRLNNSTSSDSTNESATPYAVKQAYDKALSNESVINQTFSVNQNYLDMTSQRSIGVTYRNTTNKPIFVNVASTSMNMYGSGINMIVNNKSVDQKLITGFTEWTSVAMRMSVLAFVPPNATYRVDVDRTEIALWMEYR